MAQLLFLLDILDSQQNNRKTSFLKNLEDGIQVLQASVPHGYGSYVVIAHDNGVQTLYGHMSKVTATVGDRVSQGEQIGNVGNSGKATGMHLHFEVRGAKNPFAR